jgi:serine/threonine protein kinase
VKVADFGVAKFVGRDESTPTGRVWGKFGYISPEQASGDEVDRRSDVFSLGVVLWEALTGERLFETTCPLRTLDRLRALPPPSPASVHRDIDDAIAAVALRCLAKAPAERYETADDLARALRAALGPAGVPVDATDVGDLVRRLFGAASAELLRRVQSPAEPPTSRWTPDGRDEGTPTAPRPSPARALARARSRAAWLCLLSLAVGFALSLLLRGPLAIVRPPQAAATSHLRDGFP